MKNKLLFTALAAMSLAVMALEPADAAKRRLQPVQAPGGYVQAPQKSPAQGPMQGPVQGPMQAPIQGPKTSPVQAPMQAPVQAPGFESDKYDSAMVEPGARRYSYDPSFNDGRRYSYEPMMESAPVYRGRYLPTGASTRDPWRFPKADPRRRGM